LTDLPGDPNELAYLASYDANEYPHPSVAVDVVLLTVSGGLLRTLLVRRTSQPQLDRWAVPGGFVGMDESLDDAAARVLASKAGLDGVFTEQLYTFGDPGRDPRTRVISVVYYALVEPRRLELGYAPIGFELLPATFTLLELRGVHEAILGRPLNKDSFRRTIVDRGLVEPTGERATGLGHRPPELYRFVRKG